MASRYLGDEYGYLSVLKFNFEEGNIQQMPYQIPADLIAGNGNCIILVVRKIDVIIIAVL